MTGPKVLLIDNDADSIAIYSLILRHHGFVVVHARDAETGFELAVEYRPDVVITEIFLPRAKGATLVDRLSADDRTATMPVIILDSIPSFGEHVPATRRAQRRLTKPCEPSRLLLEVQRLLEQPIQITH